MEQRHGIRAEPQLPDDVLLDRAGGRGGQGQGWGTAEQLADFPDPRVVGPEVVAPLADAMGLVDGQQRDLPLGDHGPEVGILKPLGGDVEQLVLPCGNGCIAGLPLLFGE